MSTPPTISDLKVQYSAKIAEYDAKVSSTLATNDTTKLAELRALNQEIHAILDQILSDLASKGDESKLREQRSELLTNLNRIQRDYNGLSEKTDSLELLRRIREGETGGSREELLIYLFGFFLICVGILAVSIFGTSVQNIDATPARTMIPPSTAPFV